jgi:hypothetical protein
MMTTLPLGHYLLTPPVLLPAAHFDEEQREVTHGFLAEGFAGTARYRVELSRQEGLFEDFYRQIEAGGGSLLEIEAVADEVHEAEERARAGSAADLQRVTLGVQYYRRLYRRRHDRYAGSMIRLGEEILDVCGAWLELYQNLEIRLRKFASDRDPTAPSKTFSDGAEAVRYLRSLAAVR